MMRARLERGPLSGHPCAHARPGRGGSPPGWYRPAGL